MKRRTIISSLGLALTGGCLRNLESGPSESTSPPGAKSNTPEDGTTESKSVKSVEFNELWTAAIGAVPSTNHSYLDEGIIVGHIGGQIARLDASTGNTVWEVSNQSEMSLTQVQMGQSNGNVYTANGDSFFAIDVESGDVRWQTPIPVERDNPDGISVISEANKETVVFAYSTTESGGLVGVDVSTGEPRWTHRDSKLSEQFGSWLSARTLSPPIGGWTIVTGWNTKFWLNFKSGEIQTESAVPSKYRPTVKDGRLYTVAGDKLVCHEVSPLSASKLWEFKPMGSVSTMPVVADDVVYFGSDDAGLYAVADGDRKWRYRADGPIEVSPVLLDSFVIGGRRSIFAIDRESGDGAGSTEITPQAITADTSRIYVSTTSDTIGYSVD